LRARPNIHEFDDLDRLVLRILVAFHERHQGASGHVTSIGVMADEAAFPEPDFALIE
jgi:hypothetical protein